VSDPALASPPFDPASLVGTTLDGRYVLCAHLATGGMGAVFRAHHVHLRKDFAVKVLRPDLTASPDIVERFRREAEIASALEHDNIVKVSDFGRSEAGYLFLVMELLAGESLFERLRREGFLPPEEAVPILWQVCAALEAAHAAGVIHRDLKPENVFLARTGSGREVTKILDFGIAKIADATSENATQAGIVVGTPEYLSPEQAMGSAIDGRADVYAVGLIAFRALTGRHPFKAPDARALLMMQATRPVPLVTDPRPDLIAWPGLVAAVAKACAKEAGARHQSAGDLKDDLAAALGPAFMMPPGATPAPASSLTLPPLPELRSRDGGAPRTTRALVPADLAPAAARATVAERARAASEGARDALRRAVTAGRGRAAEVKRAVRARPLAWATGGAALTAALVLGGLLAWTGGRTAAQARALLSGDRPAEARALLETALEDHPGDHELLLLRGRALHRLPGRAADGVEAYAAARARGPLDGAAFEDLVQDLGRERSLADKAARLLRDDAEQALPAVLRAAEAAPGAHRLRALALARDLGAEERIDRIAAYAGLLADPECDVRRAAARRLGELGDTRAVAPLRKAAQAKVETKGFFGRTKQSPACAASEADAAARRIEAARLPQR
jgi:serine/threonine-protein kinase